MEYKLYIREIGKSSYREIDIFEPDKITLTKQVTDLREIFVSRSEFVQDIGILGTPRTQEALGSPQTFDNQKTRIIKYEAKLLVGGADVLEGGGLLYLTSWQYVGDIHRGTALLVGGRAVWVEELQNIKLVDLDLGSHVKVDALVRNSWDRRGKNGTVYDRHYIGGAYFPVNYGHFTSPPISIHIDDLYFHQYVLNILEAGFSAIGWRLTGDWIESDAANGYVRLYNQKSVLTGSETVLSLSDPINKSVRDGSPLHVEAYEYWNVFSTQWDNPSRGCWKAATDQKFTFSYTYTGGYYPNLGTGFLELHIISNKRGLLFTDVFVDTGGNMNNLGSPFCIQAHEELCFIVVEGDVSDPSVFQFVNPAPQYLTITTEPLDTICLYSMDTFPALLLPDDESPADVLFGLIDMEGLIPISNVAKKEVQLIPFDLYYASRDIKDLSQLLDFNGGVSENNLNSIPCTNLTFTYKAGEGEALQEWKSQYGEEYGSYKVINDPNSTCEKIYENRYFHATHNEHYFWWGEDTRIASGWWVNVSSGSDDEGEKNLSISPRIVQYYGLVDTTLLNSGYSADLAWSFNNAFGLFAMTDLPYAYFFDGLGVATDAERRNLMYGEKTIYDIDNVFDYIITRLPGLTQVAFKGYMKLLTTNRFIEVSGSFSLLDYLLSQLNSLWAFTSKGHGTGLFYLSSIADYSPMTGKSKMILGLIEEPCRPDTCPSNDDLGFRYQIVLNGTEFGGGGALLRLWPAFSDPQGLILEVISANSVWVRTTNIATSFSRTYTKQTDGSWTVTTFQVGNDFHPAHNNPFIYSYDMNVWTRDMQTHIIRTVDGKVCTLTLCHTIVVRGFDYAQQLVWQNIQSACTPSQIKSFALDASSCIQDFPEKNFTAGLADYNDFLLEVRTYQIIDFQVDGSSLYPELWVYTSSPYYTINAVPVEVTGTSFVSDLVSPNNFYAFVRWFNYQFPFAGATTGLLGGWGSPVKFQLHDNTTHILYSTTNIWSLTIRKQINTGASFDYFFSWDGSNFYYNFNTAGAGKPLNSRDSYIDVC